VTNCLGFHPDLLDAEPFAMIDTRIVIETGVLPHVARRMKEDATIHERLSVINRELAQARNLAQFVELDIQFHRGLIENSGLTPLIPFADVLTVFFQRFRESVKKLKALKPGIHPKQVIAELSETLLKHYRDKPLIDAYDVFQHLMDYWAEVMQDDCYLIATDGWKAATYRFIETKPGKGDKPGKQVDKGWACDLVPKPLIVARYFAKEQAALGELAAKLEAATAKLAELEEEHGSEDGAFSELEKVNKAAVSATLREWRTENGELRTDEIAVFEQWSKLNAKETDLKQRLKKAEAELDAKAYAKYPTLAEAEVKALVVEDKWLAALDARIHGEMDRVSQQLTARVRELADRYDAPLPTLTDRAQELEAKVAGHLERMGYKP